MMWAYHRCSYRGIGSYAGSGVYQSYLRWYYTQTRRMPTENDNIWLKHQPHEEGKGILEYNELFSRRAPGNSCLSALASDEMGTIDFDLSYSDILITINSYILIIHLKLSTIPL